MMRVYLLSAVLFGIAFSSGWSGSIDSQPVRPESQSEFKEFYLKHVRHVKASASGIDITLIDNSPPLTVLKDRQISREVNVSELPDQTLHLPIQKSVYIFGDCFGLTIYPASEEIGEVGFVFERKTPYFDRKSGRSAPSPNRSIGLLLKPRNAPADTTGRELYFLNNDLEEARRILQKFGGYMPDPDYKAIESEKGKAEPTPKQR